MERITYRELRKRMESWSEWELDCDITILDAYDGECFLGEIIMGKDTHGSLDEYHPVIRFER